MKHPLVYLVVCSAWNRARHVLRQMRKPKYLAGVVVTVLYFRFVVFGQLRSSGSLEQAGRFVGADPELFGSLGALALVVFLAGLWVFPRKAALGFSETDIALLFPAPLSRRALVLYRLARLQVGTVVSLGLLLGIYAVAGGGRNIGPLFLGWWSLLTLLTLHGIAASFTRERLRQGLAAGPGQRVRAVATAAGVAVVAGAGLLWAWRVFPAPLTDGEARVTDHLDWLAEVLGTGPWPWVLALPRLAVEPMLATGWTGALVALGPALVLLGAHVWWILRLDASFEEASLQLAEKRSARLARMRSSQTGGTGLKFKAQPPAWPLRPRGWAGAALAWKTVTQFGRWMGPRRGWLLVVAAAVAGGVAGAWAPLVVRVMAATMAGTFLFFLLVAGGQMIRFDLRQDFDNLDLLKSLPVRGRTVVAGEMGGTLWLLFLGEAVLLALVLGLVAARPEGWEALAGGLWAVVPAFVIVAGPMNAANVLGSIALLLLFPAWHVPDPTGQQGFARMGLGLLLFLFQFVLVGVVLVPAGLAGGAFFVAGAAVGGPALGWLAGAVAFAVPAAAGCWLFAELLGEDFESLDLARE